MVATHFKVYSTHGDIKIRGRSERVLTTGNRKMNLGRNLAEMLPAPHPSVSATLTEGWGFPLTVSSDQRKGNLTQVCGRSLLPLGQVNCLQSSIS